MFIAPDGFLHNLPFAALPTRLGRWIKSARIALVESVASVLHPPVEGRALSGATVVTAHRIGDDDRPYAPILAAKDEGTVRATLRIHYYNYEKEIPLDASLRKASP